MPARKKHEQHDDNPSTSPALSASSHHHLVARTHSSADRPSAIQRLQMFKRFFIADHSCTHTRRLLCNTRRHSHPRCARAVQHPCSALHSLEGASWQNAHRPLSPSFCKVACYTHVLRNATAPCNLPYHCSCKNSPATAPRQLPRGWPTATRLEAAGAARSRCLL
jgi:hypothetical protein